jgi:assimilatory nitrate reductase catalytic subunit
LWWSRSRLAQGWLYELAGDAPIEMDGLLLPGERLEAVDHARGMRRIAVRSAQGRLLGALYLTRSGSLPPRDWVAAQLGQTHPEPAELLAARPRMAAPEQGPIVCVCHAIGANIIVAAAGAGAGSVAAIGEVTRAGSNCGSCRPAIARLLATVSTTDAPTTDVPTTDQELVP